MHPQEKSVKPQLLMRRPHLDKLPELVLPAAYAERCYQAGDDAAWCEIISESFEEAWSVERFQEYMQGDSAYKPERIRFICDQQGTPCATTSAYRRLERYGADAGYIHMVGVLKREAGKRLGYASSLAALHQFKRESCHNAVLQTDDFRLAAVKTYINLGFVPEIIDDNQYQRWQDVYKILKLDAPATIFA